MPPELDKMSVKRMATGQQTFRVMWAACLLTPAAIRCQTTPQPRFEVTSVKPAGNIISVKPQRSGGRIRWTTDLCYLIGYAYRLDSSRLSAPCNRTYAVEATFDPGATDDQVRQMMQSLLTDRFKMRAHRVTTEANGLALSVEKGGLKIREDDTAGEPYMAATLADAGVVTITGRGASISQLAETLQRGLGTPVWDRTGLSGIYSFTFRYAQDLIPNLKADAPSLATTLRESLGLKLEKQKGPVETLVIEHIEEPSEN